MRLLVRRYITAEQRKRDDYGITEDDVMEIRQDISTLRFELIDILSTNGMKTPNVNPKDCTCKSVRLLTATFATCVCVSRAVILFLN